MPFLSRYCKEHIVFTPALTAIATDRAAQLREETRRDAQARQLRTTRRRSRRLNP